MNTNIEIDALVETVVGAAYEVFVAL